MALGPADVTTAELESRQQSIMCKLVNGGSMYIQKTMCITQVVIGVTNEVMVQPIYKPILWSKHKDIVYMHGASMQYVFSVHFTSYGEGFVMHQFTMWITVCCRTIRTSILCHVVKDVGRKCPEDSIW